MSRAFKTSGGALTPWLAAPPKAPPRPLLGLGAPTKLPSVQVPATVPILPTPPAVTTPFIWAVGPPLKPAAKPRPALFSTGGFPLRTQSPATRLLISGVTKDSAGAILGSCTVTLYRTVDDLVLERAISDAVTGAYAFGAVSASFTYYVVAYKAGSPDVAGTSVNTLRGA